MIRAFHITFHIAKNNGYYFRGSISFTSQDRFPSKKIIKEIIVNYFKHDENDKENICIENIFEFKNLEDFKNFQNEKI